MTILIICFWEHTAVKSWVWIHLKIRCNLWRYVLTASKKNFVLVWTNVLKLFFFFFNSLFFIYLFIFNSVLGTWTYQLIIRREVATHWLGVLQDMRDCVVNIVLSLVSPTLHFKTIKDCWLLLSFFQSFHLSSSFLLHKLSWSWEGAIFWPCRGFPLFQATVLSTRQTGTTGQPVLFIKMLCKHTPVCKQKSTHHLVKVKSNAWGAMVPYQPCTLQQRHSWSLCGSSQHVSLSLSNYRFHLP